MRPLCQISRAMQAVSAWEMWFTAMITPPCSGIRSRWCQRIRKNTASNGYSTRTQSRIQNPALGLYWRDTLTFVPGGRIEGGYGVAPVV